MDRQPHRCTDDDETPFFLSSQNMDPLEKLQKLLKEGYEPARKYFEAYKKFQSLVNLVSKTSERNLKINHTLQLRIVLDLVPILQINSKLPNWPLKVLSSMWIITSLVVKRHSSSTPSTSELDKAIRICQLYFTCLDNPNATLALAIECSEKYPMEPYFHSVHSTMLRFFGRTEEGLLVSNKALEIAPTDLNLLFNRAVFLKNTKGSSIKERIEAWEVFLQQTSKIDRHVSESYYEIGLITASEILPQAKFCKVFTRALNTMEKAIQNGEDAEKYILPQNLPDVKNLNSQKVTIKLAIAQAECQLSTIKNEDQKSREIILNHRSLCYLTKDLKSEESVAKLSKINIFDTKSEISSSVSIKLTKYTSIEPAVITTPESGSNINVSLVLEQNFYREIIKCKVSNFDITKFGQEFQSREIQELFGIGCKISIANNSAKECQILIDNPCPCSLAFHLEERLDRLCYYCGIEGAPMKCVKCKVANYCDSHCQKRDWKVFDHRKFCTKMMKCDVV